MPAGAQPELEAATGEHVDGRGLARGDQRIAEVVVEHERADTQRRDRRDRGERGVGGPRLPHHVVRHRERAVAERLDATYARDPILTRPRRDGAELGREADLAIGHAGIVGVRG